MVKSMVSGVAGLRAHQSKMDVIGNNIANVNTYGFKSSRALFRDALYMTTTGSSNATQTYGGGNAMQTGYGSTLGSVDVMHVRGAYTPTDYGTDCMINGQGFFLVGADQGVLDVGNVTSLNLTRVGAFVFDGAGNFVDLNRNLVYGFQATPRQTQATDKDGNLLYEQKPKMIEDPPGSGNYVQETDSGGNPVFEDDLTKPIMKTVYDYDYSKVQPITMPLDSNGEQMKLSQITVGADGSIIGIDSNNNVVEVAKIAVANVPNPSALEASENSYYIAKANTGDILASVPGENTTGALRSGGLEMSTVDLAKEFTEMITTQRGYQANTRIITVTDEMLQELVNIKR